MFYIHLKDGSQRGDSRDALDLQGRNKAFEHMGRFSFEHLTLFDSDSANGGSGQFSYRLKQDGEPYANSHQLVRQTDLETLLTETRAILQTMGREILAGTIAVDPYRKGSERPCTFCEYQSICRIDPWAHRYRPLKPILAAGP